MNHWLYLEIKLKDGTWIQKEALVSDGDQLEIIGDGEKAMVIRIYPEGSPVPRGLSLVGCQLWPTAAAKAPAGKGLIARLKRRLGWTR